MEKVFIPVLLGTSRVGRNSERVAKFVFEEFKKEAGVETVFIDVKEHLGTQTLPPWGEGGADTHPTFWKKTMGRADGLFIVTPEYNRGYPGELKMFLDSIYDEYARKPLLLCAVSTNVWGGRHVVEHLRPVAAELQMVTLHNNIYVPRVESAFDEKGNPTDQKFLERLRDPFEELLWYARALKVARNTQ